MRLMIAGLALGVVVPTVAAREVDAKKFGWHSDYATAKAEAKRTGKPMLVVFRCEP